VDDEKYVDDRNQDPKICGFLPSRALTPGRAENMQLIATASEIQVDATREN